MREVVGILIMVFGAFLGAYLGIYVCFIGGIVDIIDQIKAPVTDSYAVAFGVVKIMFAGFVGWASFLLTSSIGAAIADSGKYKL